jgi:hypothetical protein
MHKKDGDFVYADEPLFVIETDKVTLVAATMSPTSFPGQTAH